MTILAANKLPPDLEAAHCRQKLTALKAVTNGSNALEMHQKGAPYRLRLAELEQSNPQQALPMARAAQ